MATENVNTDTDPEESEGLLTSWDQGLSEKQRLFVIFYCQYKNASRAAREAGYSADSAYIIGHENLRKPKIIDAINAYLAAYSITEGEAKASIAEKARGSMAHFLKVDESGRVIVNLAHEDAVSHYNIIKKVKQRVITHTTDDRVTEEVWTEVELYDSLAAARLALELLGKVPTGVTSSVNVVIMLPDDGSGPDA